MMRPTAETQRIVKEFEHAVREHTWAQATGAYRDDYGNRYRAAKTALFAHIVGLYQPTSAVPQADHDLGGEG